MVKRKIIKIDEDKCDGCGLCVPACAEGALQIIDGKAKLVSDKYCDGLGACLGECPQGAISFEDRDAEEFDEAAVEERLNKIKKEPEPLACGCPGSMAQTLKKEKKVKSTDRQESALGQWPVQLMLVNPSAPYFQDADLVLAADCVPFTYANFHPDFLERKALAVGCPKLDDAEFYVKKLTEILKTNNIKSLHVIIMEVPCCSGLEYIAKSAIAASGKGIPLQRTTISLQGEVK
jgi:NAD-dependent dihydropyrimidine dehydrogenase PreA subunit